MLVCSSNTHEFLADYWRRGRGRALAYLSTASNTVTLGSKGSIWNMSGPSQAPLLNASTHRRRTDSFLICAPLL